MYNDDKDDDDDDGGGSKENLASNTVLCYKLRNKLNSHTKVEINAQRKVYRYYICVSI